MIVESGLITQLSVSQVESFDAKQTGGCPRRWWFERANDLRPEQTRGQSEGEAGHALLARYLETGERPKGRVKMGKAVTGAILKGDLPEIGPDLLIEQRFSGQAKFDTAVCECGHALHVHAHCEFNCAALGCDCTKFRPRWIPLDVAETLHIAGVPWEGFIDLAFRRDGPGQWGGGIPTIVDHKFLSDLTNAKQPSELIRTVQLPVYVLSQVPYWPDAKRWRIAHHNVSKRGVDSCVRAAIVTLDEVHERIADVESIVAQMKGVAPLENQSDVPHARRPGHVKNPCDAWNGCPHQSICSAFRSSNSTAAKGATPVQLTPEEAAILGDLDDVTLDDAPAPAIAAPVVAAPTPAPKPRAKLNVIDVNMCVCGAEITDVNGSQLRSGYWLHLDCPQQAKQRADAAAKELAAKPNPPAPVQIPVSVLPPDAPASKPELASEQPPPPKEPKARKPRAPAAAPAPIVTSPAAIVASPAPIVTSPAATVLDPNPQPRPTPPLPPRADILAGSTITATPRAAAVASVLRSIASLLET